jgi:glycosyltransferase involved in cell wall biosynthesis
MKIGIDIRMLGRKRTGDETVFFNLVKNLALIDSDNEYSLFIDKRSSDEMATIAQSLGIEEKKNFHLIALPTHNKFVWNFWTLPKYLREHPVDVYHTQYIVPFFVARSIKIVTHIHDVSFRVYPEYIGWKDRFFLNVLIPRSLRRADKIIAVSAFTKQEIVKYYPTEERKTVVVPNALSDDFLNYEKSSPERIAMVRQKYSLPSTFILYVGTLQPRKNIPALIRAFSLIQEKLLDTSLVIVGNKQGHHYDRGIDTAIEEENLQERVVFSGFVCQDELAVIMQEAKMFVFPSLYEGFGLPVLEAMSQRVPIVASDIAPLREVGGEAAMFADTRNLVKFSEILYTISTVAESRTELVSAGIKQIEHFSWRVSAGSLRDVYQSLV